MNWLITNARIYPSALNGTNPRDSVLVEDGIITCIGDQVTCDSAAKNRFEKLDLRGKALLPSFCDSHTHFTEFARKGIQLDLTGCATIKEITDRIVVYLETCDDLPAWILGGGWDSNIIDEPRNLTFKFLDNQIPSIPVALYSKDYHSRWCNSLALKIAGINFDTPDPLGGKIHRSSNGEITGILYETAAELIEPFVQLPGDNQMMRLLKQAAETIHRLGITSLHSMETQSGARVLEDFVRDTRLIRVCRHFYLHSLDDMIASGAKSYNEDNWYRMGGLKLFADGALGSLTAAIDHEYPLNNGNRGILRHSTEELASLISLAEEHNLSPTIHAIGNRAIRTALDALELSKVIQNKNQLRRVEHVQAIDDRDVARLKAAGVYCSVQPVHLANDIDMIESNWAPLKSHTYAFRALLDAGLTLGFGSDAPIETINPFHGIYAAISRKKGLNPQQESWCPEQKISLEEAINAYTLGAAMGSRMEDHIGSISLGKAADLLVLDDFSNESDEFWLSAESRLTMLGGEIVWHDSSIGL